MDKKGKRKLVHAMTIRIALPALLTILLFVTAIFLIILPSLKENLLAKKRELLQEVTKITWDMVATYEKMERSGVLSRTEAQHQAMEMIKNFRYGSENKDYFWINDMSAHIVVHPYRPDLHGEPVPDFRYPMGKTCSRSSSRWSRPTAPATWTTCSSGRTTRTGSSPNSPTCAHSSHGGG
jgi:Cache domain.